MVRFVGVQTFERAAGEEEASGLHGILVTDEDRNAAGVAGPEVIDHRGEILESGAQFAPVMMTHDVQPRTGSTPYVRVGNKPVVLLCLAVMLGVWLRARASL